MPDALAESGKVKIWIVFVVQIIVGHIGMSEAMHCDRMGKADGPANLSMGLQGAGMAAATKGERRQSADIFVLPLDLGVFFLDPQLSERIFWLSILFFIVFFGTTILSFYFLPEGFLLSKNLIRNHSFFDSSYHIPILSASHSPPVRLEADLRINILYELPDCR